MQSTDEPVTFMSGNERITDMRNRPGRATVIAAGREKLRRWDGESHTE